MITTEELIAMIDLDEYTMLHIHHTYKPHHDNFDGSNHEELQENMKNFHVNVNGWSDYAYHGTSYPDGKWLEGRDFDMTPASIRGKNTGAFSIVMIGDFDEGNDEFKDPQKSEVIKLARYFYHNDKEILFHREGPGVVKTCPGNSIDKEKFMELVRHDTDYENHWAKEEIERMMEEDIFNETKEFRPSDPISRAEMAIVADRIMEWVKRNG